MSGNHEQFEREFESFLNEEDSRLAALYRKLPRPEPDAKLDAAVLAMARRAQANSPPARLRSPRWIPALSAAAVVMLAAGITFRLGPTVWQERDTRALQKTTNENAAPAVSAPQPATAKLQPADSDSFKDKAAPKPAPASPVVSAPGEAAEMGAAAARQEIPARSKQTEPAARRVDTPTAQAFPMQAPVDQEKKAEVSAGNAVDATQVPGGAAADAQTFDNKRDEQTAQPEGVLKMREERVPPPAAAPPAPASEMRAPATAMESTTAPTPAASGAPAESALAAPGPAAAKAARMGPPHSNDPNARLYPEHWLQNIRSMLRDNKRDEALRSLAEFRKIYPAYHLPDDLRDLK